MSLQNDLYAHLLFHDLNIAILLLLEQETYLKTELNEFQGVET